MKIQKPISNFICLWVVTLPSLILLFSPGAIAGKNSGGGGSDEARVFSKVAIQEANLYRQSKERKAYGEQLLKTLDSSSGLEIIPVKSLIGVCDGQGINTDDFAYSCVGKINLLTNPWKAWLTDEATAYKHIQDIIHEVSRASDPKMREFVTSDNAYSETNRIYADPIAQPNVTRKRADGLGVRSLIASYKGYYEGAMFGRAIQFMIEPDANDFLFITSAFAVPGLIGWPYDQFQSSWHCDLSDMTCKLQSGSLLGAKSCPLMNLKLSPTGSIILNDPCRHTASRISKRFND